MYCLCVCAMTASTNCTSRSLCSWGGGYCEPCNLLSLSVMRTMSGSPCKYTTNGPQRMYVPTLDSVLRASAVAVKAQHQRSRRGCFLAEVESFVRLSGKGEGCSVPPERFAFCWARFIAKSLNKSKTKPLPIKKVRIAYPLLALESYSRCTWSKRVCFSRAVVNVILLLN